MEVMFVLIGFSLLVAAGFLVAFFFSLKRGQYDDLTTPSIRMLFESRPRKKKND